MSVVSKVEEFLRNEGFHFRWLRRVGSDFDPDLYTLSGDYGICKIYLSKNRGTRVVRTNEEEGMNYGGWYFMSEATENQRQRSPQEKKLLFDKI